MVAALAHAVRFPAAERVVFVCTQNSADHSWLQAAGTDAAASPSTETPGPHPADRVHPRAVNTARRHGSTWTRPVHTRLDDILTPEDLVVSVCDSAHEDLRRRLKQSRPVLHWAVADPAVRDTDDAFETAFTQLTERLELLSAAVPSLT
jgi:protein-tyrosine-phosphatase